MKTVQELIQKGIHFIIFYFIDKRIWKNLLRQDIKMVF